MKRRILRVIRNSLIGAGVLLVLIVGAGVAYTWYNGQNPSTVAATPAPQPPAPVTPVMKPPQLSPNAAESASVQMLSSPVKPGAPVSLTVRTNPVSTCTAGVLYDDKVPSHAAGLGAQTADDYGMVSWSWTIEPTAPLGTWPVTVTCVSGKKSAIVRGDLNVVR